MSIPSSLTPLFNSGSSGAGGLQIERSLRFNSSDSAYLSRVPAVAGNRRTWTWSGWVKRSKLSEYVRLFNNTASGNAAIQFMDTDKLRLFDTAISLDLQTTQVFRDPSSWYHIVAVIDTTQGTSSDRAKLYVNGSQITAFSTSTYPSLNADGGINNNNTHQIGSLGGSSEFFNGYLTNIHFIDGQQLTPSSFTETDATTGQLIPKTYTGSYGTNGFNLLFADNSSNTASTLGKDTSGLSNNWTPNNLSTTTGDPTSVAAASGALPVLNTTDTYGAVKGTGTRTDTNSTSIVLALPMDGTNGGTSFGDQSAVIKGSGSAKTVTVNGNTNTSTATSKFYGSSGYFDGSGDYLTTPDDADFTLGSSNFTIEFWLNPSVTAGSGVFGIINSSASTASTAFYAQLSSTNTLLFSAGDGGGETNFTSTAIFTASTWNHGAIVRSGNTVNFYFNGVLDKSISFTRVVANQSTPFTIGRLGDYVGAGYYNGYIQDFRIYNGAAKYTGSFNPPSATANATIAAGNDSLVDSPTNYGTDTAVGGEVRGNYATWNPLAKNSRITSSDGNLTITSDTSATHQIVYGTFSMVTGKWYWEVNITSAGGAYPNGPVNVIGVQSYIGFADGVNTGSSGTGFGWGYQPGNGGYYYSNFTASGTAPVLANGVIAFAYDADTGKLWLRSNTGSWVQGDPASGTSPSATRSGANTAIMPCISFLTFDSNIQTANLNAGQRAFAYTAPSGFKALCTQNLPAPLVTKSNTVFDVVTYTGNAGTQSITGLAFNPDFVWIKGRNATPWHALFDSVRGTGLRLSSNVTNAETGNGTTDLLQSFNSNGFTVNATLNGGPDSSVNWDGSGGAASSYVAWTWDAGTSTVSNTAGSITSQVRANATAGFSVITYTGTGANATVGHGLGVAPTFIIVKSRTSGARQWPCYHIGNKGTGNNLNPQSSYIYLNLTNSAPSTGYSGFWNDTAPTSTVFSIGTDGGTNASAENFVAYAFTPVVGYNSFGSYTGNGSTDGPFVYTGFRPRFVMVKRSDGVEFWVIIDSARDPYNGAGHYSFPNHPSAEGSGSLVIHDLLSNGFKLRYQTADVNSSGGTYIYAAFAEAPINYSRGR